MPRGEAGEERTDGSVGVRRIELRDEHPVPRLPGGMHVAGGVDLERRDRGRVQVARHCEGYRQAGRVQDQRGQEDLSGSVDVQWYPGGARIG